MKKLVSVVILAALTLALAPSCGRRVIVNPVPTPADSLDHGRPGKRPPKPPRPKDDSARKAE